MSPAIVQSSTGRKLIDRLKFLGAQRGIFRLRLHRAAILTLIYFVGGVFFIGLLVTAIAIFAGDLPGWLTEEVRTYVLVGQRNAELTLDYLMRWGIVDLFRRLFVQVLTLGVGLAGVLFIFHILRKSVRLIPWAIGRAAQTPPQPRIRLTRSLCVSINDSSNEFEHRFELHVDIVLRRGGDTVSVIGQLSTIVPTMLRATQEVMKRLNADMDADQIADAMSRAATKRDKRIRRVEIRDVVYAMIQPTDGSVLFTQNLPVKQA